MELVSSGIKEFPWHLFWDSLFPTLTYNHLCTIVYPPYCTVTSWLKGS